jgi:hypothetical protein
VRFGSGFRRSAPNGGEEHRAEQQHLEDETPRGKPAHEAQEDTISPRGVTAKSCSNGQPRPVKGRLANLVPTFCPWLTDPQSE